jgi:hypothetical protein
LSVVNDIDDLRVDGAADGGNGVMRFSGGGIVDLRNDGDADGGSGVIRFSDAVGSLREDGSTVERTAATSSSRASGVSPPRGSREGVCVEDRRDEPFAELCG